MSSKKREKKLGREQRKHTWQETGLQKSMETGGWEGGGRKNLCLWYVHYVLESVQWNAFPHLI